MEMPPLFFSYFCDVGWFSFRLSLISLFKKIPQLLFFYKTFHSILIGIRESLYKWHVEPTNNSHDNVILNVLNSRCNT
jgi:hypothetical protein